MKRVYLLRHAKSSWAEPGLPDIERPLNKRGQKDAPMMGKRLNKRKVSPQLLISSPAKRALATARIIAEKIGYPQAQIEISDEVYAAGATTLLRIVKRVDDSIVRVMLVGHNPELEGFLNYLVPDQIDKVPTCAVACIDFAVDSWKKVARKKGTLAFFDYPKKQSAG
jgi:phosphohistidine phosphatase